MNIIDGFLRKLQSTGSIERTPEAVDHGVLKMRCFYVRYCGDTIL